MKTSYKRNQSPVNSNRIRLSQLRYQPQAMPYREQAVRTCIIKDRFFRIHPDHAIEAVISHLNNRWYLLDGKLVEDYGQQLRYVSMATLLQGMTEYGETFLLPITEPWPGHPESWRDSLFDIAERAKEEWVKISPNHGGKCYDIIETAAANSRPLAHWPQDDFEDIVNEAFADELFIESVKHPVMEEVLQG